jgi:HAD superfamily phosphatase (TIGR01668 family)
MERPNPAKPLEKPGFEKTPARSTTPHPLGPAMLQRFCPALRLRRITDVTPEFLAEHGLRALVLDLDNTLVAWRGEDVAPEIEAWVKATLAAGIPLCIVSNTHRPRRLKSLATRLGVQWVPSGGKPRRRGFREALVAMGSNPSETAVVGDQLLTDIWGGNRTGLLTILVEPLSEVEFWGTRVISRRLEGLFLKRLESWGLLPAHRQEPPGKERG